MAQVTADDPGGANLRRWMPVLLLPAVLGWLRLAGERHGVFDAATGTAMMMIIFIVGLAVLAYTSARPVSRSSMDLRESEERYRSLFDSMAEAFALHEIVTDERGQPCDYRFLEVNDSFERMTGMNRSDVVNRNVREVLPGIESFWIETYGRVALTGEPVSFEKYYPAPLDRWYEIFAYRPAPRRFAVIFLDISQRKRSEEALWASETRLRRFYESGLLGVIYWNMQGQITDANTKFLEMVGYDREDLAAGRLDWAKMTAPEDRHLDEQSAVELKATGVNKEPFEKAFIRKDGTRLPVIVAGAMLDEARSHGVAFVLDITERKRAEESLREAKAQLELRVRERTAELTEVLQALRQTGNYTRSLIEASLDPLVTIGRDGTITDVNGATEAATGRVRQELIGTDFSTCFTEPEMARIGYQRVFDEGSVRDYPLEIRHRHGRTIPVLYNAALYRDDAGRVVGIIAAARDITERKRAEGELRTANETLEHRTADLAKTVDALKSEVEQRRKIEQALREANEQLASRAAQLRALAGELTLAEQRERRRLAKILHDHLQQLLVGAKFRVAILGKSDDDVIRNRAAEVEGLLDESIRASRSLTAELSPPILHDVGLLHGLGWLARWMSERHGLFVDLVVEGDIPLLVEDVKVLLFESVKELLFNAVKHARVHTASVNVRLIEGTFLQITVSDAGPGLSPDALKPAGTAGGGYGLFSIRERLGLIGGRLDIDSAPGKGSRFVLIAPITEGMVLPLKPVSGATVGSGDLQANQVPYPIRDAVIRVLLADDHAIMRQGLASLLGAELDIEIVGQASDGQEAVLMAGRLLPDVILMDMNMPNLNGIEATRAIHKDCPGIRIIGLSMFEESVQAQAMRDAGAVNYLSKSGPSETLVEAIRACASVGGKDPRR